ncbi:MAG: alpha-mannosidase, partial [Spirochaetales bacterium]|nr:alpha-mannosidase [Spirochaetales bacterium]
MSTKARQQRTLFPQFIPERIRRHVQISRSRIWKQKTSLDVLVSPSKPLLSSFEEAESMQFSRVTEGSVFAEAGWNTVWFYMELPELPELPEFTELTEEAAYLLWEVNGESTIFYQGEPWCGLDTAHRWARIPAGARELYIRCSSYETGIWMHEGENRVPEPAAEGYQFYHASAALRDTLQWNIYNDLLLLEEYLRYELEKLELTSPAVGKHKKLEYLPVGLRKLLHKTDLALDTYDLGDIHECSRQLQELLKTKETSEFLNSPNGSLSLIGNSHLDLVWLWPEKATREKNIHTCSTILRLMEEYPDMSFTMSQPWLLDALETDAPSLYRQIQERIDEQRWELTGGMYVEADTLIPCGEALARACVIGQRVFQRETGELCPTLWLPDVFGYSQSLPQIASAAGIRNFYTTKLLWSSVQSFPFTSFVWQSMDGSELLCHLSQVGYESRASVEDLKHCSEANKQAALHDDAILAMGFGDGGGGLTDEQCERAKRISGLLDLPAASWQRADQFFSRLSEVRHQLPRYRGELYLEYHRGTYTTKHAMKQAYRRAEKALQMAEAAAAFTGNSENIREQSELQSKLQSELQSELMPLWKELVFSQFHDALPGSSIALVYEEMIPQLQDIAERAKKAAAELLSNEGSRTVLFNPNGIDGTWLIHLDSTQISTMNRETGKSKEKNTVPIQ